jgi:hypothetical protein
MGKVKEANEPALSFLEELREQAQELIDLGDSHEKREGYGMMKVIDAIRPMPNNLYFELMAIGKNDSLQREEIQIHAGENGNIMIVKTDEGFVIDVYGQNDIVDTMAVWEDTLNPLEDNDDEVIDPNNFSLVEQEDFLDQWGQLTDEVCAELGYDEKDSDDLLMEDYFYYEPKKYWIPKSSSMYTPREQSIADYLRS